MSPFLACSVLHVFSKGASSLTRKQFEEAQDALVLLLEKANDEQHRLLEDTKKEGLL